MSLIFELSMALLVLVASLLAVHEAGFRIGRRRLARVGKDAGQGLGPTEGAIFALLGLLIAFTFSSAGSRFDHRRQLIAEEANAISTSYLRLDLLGPELSAPIRPLYRDYLELRIAQSRRPNFDPGQPGAFDEVGAAQAKIWEVVIAALEKRGEPALKMPVLVPLNEMIDIVSTRRMASMLHPPAIVFFALALMSALASFVAGHATGMGGHRSTLHTLLFVVAIGGAVYSIIEIEYPRLGFVTIHGADVMLIDLRTQLAPPP
jgi:hypothetical protein